MSFVAEVSRHRAQVVQRVLLLIVLPAVVATAATGLLKGPRWDAPLLSVIAWLCAAVLYKLTRYRWSFFVLMGGLFVSVVWAALYLYGIHTPGMVLLIVIPIWAMYIFGQKVGWAAWGFCALSYLAMFTWQLLNPADSDSHPQFAYMHLNRLIITTACSAAILAAGIVYERLSQHENALVQRAHDELKAAMEELNQREALLLEQAEARRVMLSMLTHDLSSPLAVSLVSLDLLEQEALPEDQKMLVTRIRSGMTSAVELLERAQTFISAQSGKVKFRTEKIELLEIFPAVSGMVSERARAKEIALVWTRRPLQVSGDPFFLKNVLFNLLTNAIKFSGPGDTVEMRAERNGDGFATIQIIDTGEGIPAELMQDLFKIDVKTSRPGTNGEKGTGLGLPLVKFYIEKMGGTMSIESQEKTGASGLHGTQVTLRLKLA